MNNYKIIIQNINYSPYKSKRSLFIGSVYRLLSYKAQENQKLGKNIENVYLINKETILLGDLNIDLLARREAPTAGRRPAGEGANIERRLVPYTRDAITDL